MSTMHLIDPELLPALDLIPSLDLRPETLPALRAEMQRRQQEMAATAPPGPDVERRELFIPGPTGAPDVRVLLYMPKTGEAARPAYLHLHGGGYVIGSADLGDIPNRLLASELGCVVLSADYRLAPDTVFPGNVEDCYAALKWLHANAASLGADPGRIAVGGESAGGGLAAALALLARDRGEVPIVHQHLIYPMIDDRAPQEAHPYTGEFVWTAMQNRFGWSCLLGREPGGPDVSPYAAAARAEKLEGLPPAFISVGALDLFLEQDLNYARRLSRAGVPVELHIYPGAFHAFDIAAWSRIARLHARDQLDALRYALRKKEA